MKMRRCEDEKMFYRLPLLEEPCAQTLSGIILKNLHPRDFGCYKGRFSGFQPNVPRRKSLGASKREQSGPSFAAGRRVDFVRPSRLAQLEGGEG